MRTDRFFLFAIIFSIFFLRGITSFSSTSESTHDIRIPILLDPPVSPLPTDVPVTLGVPFPKGMLKDVNALHLVDETGKQTPSQIEATGFWTQDGSIQWIRVDAIVTTSHHYYLTNSSTTQFSLGQVTVSVKQTSNGIELKSGEVKYILALGKSPITEIWVGANKVADCSTSRGLYVVDQKGRLASASTVNETMQIESNGPVEACVKFEGDYRTSDGEILAHHITRVELFAGNYYANVTHTLVLNRSTNEVWFTDVGWELSVPETTEPSMAYFGTSLTEWHNRDSIALTKDRPSAYMLQDSHYALGHGKNHFSVMDEDINGKSKLIDEETECGDWAALKGKEQGFFFYCRDAALQHPIEFEVKRDKINLHLFSGRSGEELDFRAKTLVKKWDLGDWYCKTVALIHQQKVDTIIKRVSGYSSDAIGWSKTHEIVFAPVSEKEPTDSFTGIAHLHDEPVYAMVEPDWLCQSKALGAIHRQDKTQFRDAEREIEASANEWMRHIPEWGDYGFVDYGMGPHEDYVDKLASQYRYCFSTYTMRPDFWLLYARSGNRSYRRFAELTNRGQMDACMVHWSSKSKTKGLFTSAESVDGPVGSATIGMLPFYWEQITVMHNESAANLNSMIWDYYLTGNRRSKDVIYEYADGVKKVCTPKEMKRNGRPLVLLRMLTQSYAFTRDPELKQLASATMDMIYHQDANLGLWQNRKYFDSPEENTLYKTNVDIRSLIEAWNVFGEPRYFETAKKIARYWWLKTLGHWPLIYSNPQGVIGSFLYDATKNAEYATGLAIQLHEAITAFDSVSGSVAGTESADKTTFLFEGIPYAEDVLASAGLGDTLPSNWIGYDDFGLGTTVRFTKNKGQSVHFDIIPPKDFLVYSQDKKIMPWNYKENEFQESIEVPANAPEGTYDIVSKQNGQHLVVSDSKTALTLLVPEGVWRPSPNQDFHRQYFFYDSPQNKSAQISFEGTARLYEPDGTGWNNGLPVHGTITLPADNPGLWGFQPTDNQLVFVKNILPSFVTERTVNLFDTTSINMSNILETTNQITDTSTFTSGGLFINKSTFQFSTGNALEKGDGNQFMPRREGTIEFWYRPNWSIVDLQNQSVWIVRLPIPSGKQVYSLKFLHASHQVDTERDFFASDVLNGYMESNGFSKEVSLQNWRATAFKPDEWVHIAWVWGWRNNLIPRIESSEVHHRDSVLVMEIYVNGKKGNFADNSWEKNLLLETPNIFELPALNATVDELRISDIQRYTGDFDPPTRDTEFKLDKHTRVLFHFNGNIIGEGYYSSKPITGILK